MDDKELRKVLSKKPKKELINLLSDLSKKSAHLQFNFDPSKLQQGILVSRIWQVLLLMKAEFYYN